MILPGCPPLGRSIKYQFEAGNSKPILVIPTNGQARHIAPIIAHAEQSADIYLEKIILLGGLHQLQLAGRNPAILGGRNAIRNVNLLRAL